MSTYYSIICSFAGRPLGLGYTNISCQGTAPASDESYKAR